MGFKKDYEFGTENEIKVMEYLREAGYTIEESTDEMSIHDFNITHDGKKVNIELKTRRAYKETYKDTLIGANKLGEAWNKFYKNGEETLFFFSYTDGLFYLNPFDIVPRREHKLQRWDRGIDSARGWLYYKTEDLKKIY